MSDVEIYNRLEARIMSEQIEVNIIDGNIPEIYYYGKGKTGSTSLKYGFQRQSVAHWHCLRYFEQIYRTNILSQNGLDLYDLCFFFGEKYSFKPLIVDSIREPIGHVISGILQYAKDWAKVRRLVWGDELKDRFLKMIRCALLGEGRFSSTPSCFMDWKKRFQVDLFEEYNINRKFLFKELENARVLFLRFEDIEDRPLVFDGIGYKYKAVRYNESVNHPVIGIAKDWINANVDKLCLTDAEFDSIYINDSWISRCYSQKEIEVFRKRYTVASKK
jgi:hypothetical protein